MKSAQGLWEILCCGSDRVQEMVVRLLDECFIMEYVVHRNAARAGKEPKGFIT
jgi:hypothetical protein